MAGPYGEFATRQTHREMVIIGGGVGMAPPRAIIFDQLQRVEVIAAGFETRILA